ncbi:phosphatidylserine/phosphatidylglycerophosphate/cardiolipin synthase family protein [Streptomyces sp. NPDC052236]|uniref:phosphatidylserine/phosphatidylglycerophosphate/ cardiolipin synthase family protein n=1 Tax=Streptomyces sp. NPDC052236 TaxID=3365686 RepID=UPI0037D0C113
MRRPSTRLLSLAAALTSLTSLVSLSTVPAGNAATGSVVTTTVTFNNPAATTAEQDAIRDHIRGLIGGAERGSSIAVSMYTFSDATVSRALVAAKQRGVSVRVILDHSTLRTNGNEYATLSSGLGTDRAKTSWVYACPDGRGCVGTRTLPGDDGAINHNKLFLFSRTRGADNVVVQTSANMTGYQRTELFNNAVTIADAGLYGIYQAYFADLLKHGTSAGLSHYYRTPSSGRYQAYFFPRRESRGTTFNNDAATDTVKLILDKVGCAPRGEATEVRMAASLFYRKEVADKLVSLASAGCSVLLAHDANPGTVDVGPTMGTVVEGIVAGKLTKRVGCWENSPSGVKIGLHSKYLTVSGTYGGVRGRKLVWTGSHNFSYPALRSNDETLLKIDDPMVFDRFKANHEELMSYCAGT